MNSRCFKAVLGAIFLCTYSCDVFEFGNQKQTYPEFDYDLTNLTVIHNIDTKENIEIRKVARIESIVGVFKDSANYYRDQMIKRTGQKPIYSMKLISKIDTLHLSIYEVPNEESKLEMGFLEDFEKGNPNKFRVFHRFYINKKLLTLIGPDSR